MTASQLHYVINAPSFDPNSGGTIFLHELAHALNALGERASLSPMKPIYWPGYKALIKTAIRPPVFARNPDLNTPMTTKADLKNPNAVVVYPEIVRDNPLGIKNVVRWLLYKPGDQHPYSFTENELFFRCFEKADMPELTGGAHDLFLWKPDRSYRNENRPDREGVAYIVRKGHRKPRLPETEHPDAINIDGMSHAQINDVFNRCDRFYSYDEATMYSQFAAICGCLSIIVPGEHKDRAAWVQSHDLGKYGVAYGTDPAELKHAMTTRDDLIVALDEKERAGLDTVRRFVTLTKERFTS
jgi:hypothetical protein